MQHLNESFYSAKNRLYGKSASLANKFAAKTCLPAKRCDFLQFPGIKKIPDIQNY